LRAGIAKRCVRIVSGGGNRKKVLQIDDMGREVMARRWIERTACRPRGFHVKFSLTHCQVLRLLCIGAQGNLRPLLFCFPACVTA
jgi:hypothetical protein